MKPKEVMSFGLSESHIRMTCNCCKEEKIIEGHFIKILSHSPIPNQEAKRLMMEFANKHNNCSKVM